jgi:hypothetical protein
MEAREARQEVETRQSSKDADEVHDRTKSNLSPSKKPTTKGNPQAGPAADMHALPCKVNPGDSCRLAELFPNNRRIKAQRPIMS